MLRHAFVLYEMRKSADGRAGYEEIGRTEVDTRRFTAGELALHLRLWAITLLREETHDLGLYTAEFSTLDDECQPDRAVAVQQIVWSGGEAQCDGTDPAVLNLLATLWSCAGVPLSPV